MAESVLERSTCLRCWRASEGSTPPAGWGQGSLPHTESFPLLSSDTGPPDSSHFFPASAQCQGWVLGRAQGTEGTMRGWHLTLGASAHFLPREAPSTGLTCSKLLKYPVGCVNLCCRGIMQNFTKLGLKRILLGPTGFVAVHFFFFFPPPFLSSRLVWGKETKETAQRSMAGESKRGEIQAPACVTASCTCLHTCC